MVLDVEPIPESARSGELPLCGAGPVAQGLFFPRNILVRVLVNDSKGLQVLVRDSVVAPNASQRSNISLSSSRNSTVLSLNQARARPCASPTEFKVAGTTGSTATLTWEADPEEVDAFRLYRGHARGMVQIATLESSLRSYTDSDLGPGIYPYFIAAVNFAGASKLAGPVEAKIDGRD
ncbi:MAG: fibronectin type III domain-containing protein [Chloroflexi bacterium]|nr:fibronectin type III domain-containing protein [Chloroflexota bacterium]